ncbi:MAG TPA: M23 family metallopeptidase [Acidimicrobiia bacterium]|nr:M23 family metallopeptidase [Acidimicrobiia bacterium]
MGVLIRPQLNTVSRRGFLRYLAGTAGAAALTAWPVPALAASELQLHFPQDPRVTYFSSTFGAPRPGGRRHEGNDLMAPKLTPVYAATDGTVTVVSDGPRSGRYVVIELSDEWSTWYMHLNNDLPGGDRGRADWSHTLAPGIEEGASVIAGQPIAFVGDSGNAEGKSPHTHFELHRLGRPINPFPYLVDAFERAVAALAEIDLQNQVEALCMPGVDAPAVDPELCPSPVGPVSPETPGIAGAD